MFYVVEEERRREKERKRALHTEVLIDAHLWIRIS
jgi:hypothetical protein